MISYLCCLLPCPLPSHDPIIFGLFDAPLLPPVRLPSYPCPWLTTNLPISLTPSPIFIAILLLPILLHLPVSLTRSHSSLLQPHERTIENCLEGRGKGAVRTLPVLANSFHSPPLYITLSLSFYYIPLPCCPPPGPSLSSLSSGPSSTLPSDSTKSFSLPSSPGCPPPRSPAPRPPP